MKTIIVFYKQNKELLKGVIFGILFMTLAFVGFKFLM